VIAAIAIVGALVLLGGGVAIGAAVADDGHGGPGHSRMFMPRGQAGQQPGRVGPDQRFKPVPHYRFVPPAKPSPTSPSPTPSSSHS
jgi:hypothetical protein